MSLRARIAFLLFAFAAAAAAAATLAARCALWPLALAGVLAASAGGAWAASRWLDGIWRQSLQAMREDFFHSIVHDVSNPLATINGFLQVVDERVETLDLPTLKTYVGYMRESCDSLRRLVQDMLDASRMSADEFAIDVSAAEPSEMLETVRGQFAERAQAKNLTITVDPGNAAGSVILCDRPLLVRALGNLLANSVKFTPRGGTIAVTGSAPNEREIEFAVADSGNEIAADKLGTVFNTHRKLEDSAGKRSGYGIGLAIAKRIVELHKGKLWAESDRGKGCRFVARIPVRQG
ncbi:MAG: HAMP domain-containing histidine kinase [Elusimicrobia bacterium]|nr:HAMP domain-containing histidine kinase [Elusimicrobiota bacterium]